MTRATTGRACYFCGTVGNPVLLAEPMEQRWGKNVLPEDTYVALKCRGCGALYVDSDVTDGYLTELYAAESEERITEVTGGVTHETLIAGRLPEFSRNWQVIKRFRPPHAGDRLLDVGCQTGEFAALAQRDGVRPTGTELSPEYAATAQQRWGAGAQVLTGPLDKMPFDAGEFSYITSFETLEHMLDPISSLQQMRRWLAAEGILALSVPSAHYFVLKTRALDTRRHPWGVRSITRGWPPRMTIPHTHIYTFSGPAMRLSLQKAGFEILHLDVSGWHGRLNRLNGWTRRISRLSGERILFGPSIFAVARIRP